MTRAEDPVVDHSAVAEEINSSINYTMYSAFRATRTGDAHATAAEVLATLEGLDGLTIRGWYDVSGMRADADVFVWWHAPEIETLQRAYATVLDAAGPRLVPAWSSAGVHRAAEFNRGHVPAFLAGDAPLGYVCVYPFVRSYDWYLLPEDERRQLLREHGAAAKDYRDVLANTVSSFALGDYEWLLPMEADNVLDLVDMMRDLRYTEARRHVREELPFYTGRRIETAEAVEVLAS